MQFLSDALDEFDAPTHEAREINIAQHTAHDQQATYITSCPPDEASDPVVRLPIKPVSAIRALIPAYPVSAVRAPIRAKPVSAIREPIPAYPVMHAVPETEDLPASTELSAPTPVKQVSMVPADRASGEHAAVVHAVPNERVTTVAKPHAILPITPLIIIYGKASSGGATILANVYASPTGRPPGHLHSNARNCIKRNSC